MKLGVNRNLIDANKMLGNKIKSIASIFVILLMND